MYDEAFTADSVTGNGSGSYFFNAGKAKESIFNMDDDLLMETIEEFGIDMSEHWGDWEGEEDEDCIMTIDFFDNGEIDTNSKAINGWLWCYEFDWEDYKRTNEEVFNRIKKSAEMQGFEIED